MKKYYLDTNFILRYLLKDVDFQYNAAQNYIVRAKQEEIKLIIATPVVFEVKHILEKNYFLPKPVLAETLFKFLSSSYLILEDRQVILDSLPLFLKGSADFEDCYLYLKAKEDAAEVLSFDKDFKRFDKNR